MEADGKRGGPAIRKLYYSIGEVSQITELPAHVLRYWETEFPQLSPKKGRSGNRMYQPRDLELVEQIKSLLYERKFTIAGARAELRKRNPDEGEQKGVVEDIRRGLKEILDILDDKSGRGAAR
ncbi:MerR family transcriptional regulator [bacterium]|nr:MerR family transcriptional regulator [bacterium]MBU1984961.1 MerR family transcriptional regulator [bacterium]